MNEQVDKLQDNATYYNNITGESHTPKKNNDKVQPAGGTVSEGGGVIPTSGRK